MLTIFVGIILARIIKNEVNMVNDLEKESSIPNHTSANISQKPLRYRLEAHQKRTLRTSVLYHHPQRIPRNRNPIHSFGNPTALIIILPIPN